MGGHDRWMVVDGGAGDLDGEVNGSIAATWYVDPDDSADERFLVTATEVTAGRDGTFGTKGNSHVTDDVETGRVATATFTDSHQKVSKVYQHWADGDAGGAASWNNNILSANKSEYFEGEVIPHVFVFQASSKAPLIPGEMYSFTITYDYYQQTTNAGGFVSLETYNISRDPDQQLAGHDPVMDDTATDGNNGFFYTIDSDDDGFPDINILSATAPETIGSGNLFQQVTVTFEYIGDGTTNLTTGGVEIYYGLKIAAPNQIEDQGQGETEGAHAWSGGSLQTTVQVGGSGATSIQLAPSAIIDGEISGIKFEDLDGDGIKDAGEPGLAGWTIYLDLDGSGDLSVGDISTTTSDGTNGNPLGFYSFSVTPDANKSTAENDPYIVREVLQAGWIQTFPAPPDNQFYTVTITSLDPNESNVDFGNFEADPSIQILKDGEYEDVGSDGLNPGDKLNYTFVVTNTGDVVITGVDIDEVSFDLVGDITVTPPADIDLSPGESATFTGSFVLDQDDIDAIFLDNDIDNVATATG